jgi:pimeloyl-ACP methyl ester carboxylesterase
LGVVGVISVVAACSEGDDPKGTVAAAGERADAGGQGGASEGDGGRAGAPSPAGAEPGGAGGEPSGGAAGGGSFPTKIPERDESELAEPVNRVGFIELAPRAYVDPTNAPNGATTTATRMFYRFIAADEDAKSKPVLVFFNGGPGFTSMLLYTFGTGPLTLDGDAPAAPPTANAASFTSIGNLLYIDARHTGFSYGLTSDPGDADERARAFDEDSLGPGADAADFVLVLLRVLEEQPALQNNRVVLVGESYGGLRASLMLNSLLYPTSLFLEDEALDAQRDAHFASVFSDVPKELHGPELFSLQFGWQVLIEPYVLSTYQEDQEDVLRQPLLEREADERGVSVDELRADYCPHDLRRLRTECDAIPDHISASLLEPTQFEAWMGVPPEDVPGLPAAQREGAFRLRTLDDPAPLDPESFTARAGQLPEWDRYFNPGVVGERTGVTPLGRAYAFPFLFSVRYVHTLITNAAYDSTVISEALVPALQQLSLEQPWLVNAEYVGGSVAAPSQRIRLEFGTGEGLPPASERIIYFPRYANSGHTVTLTEGAKLRSDVAEFLDATAE